MPVIVDPAARRSYAAFPPKMDRDWLGRVCHLSAADLEVVRRRTDETTRLGYAIQLVTVRAIGTFLPDPAAVAAPVIAAVARQLEVSDPAVLAGYRVLPVRWRHTAEIRDRCGYRDVTAQPGHSLLLAWLYRQAWSDELSPSVLFGAAHRRLLAEQILLPGHSVLARLIAAVRERAARRLHTRLVQVAPVELRARLEKLLLVPEGQRRSELDRLRRPPFTPTITGLVKALERLANVRALGVAELDLSHLPARRVTALARYADQAWATQLADLGPERRVATLLAYIHVLTASARDDVIDIFDVVFGDLQRAATHRGQKRRVGELRDYDQAVGALHARLHALLEALKDPAALATVLDDLRAEKATVQDAMDTVAALMRPPSDPFHERLVTAYPQIRRFLPMLIEAIDLEATEGAAPVLGAYHALAQWLADKPRTTRLPAEDLPLDVITPAWRTCTTTTTPPSTVPPTPAPCSMRYAPDCAAATSTPPPAPAGATPEPNSSIPRCGRPNARPRVTSWPSTPTPPPSSTSSRQAWTPRGAAPPPAWRPIPTCASSTGAGETRSYCTPWTPTPNQTP